MGLTTVFGGAALAADPHYGDIKVNERGTIHVHKHEHQADGANASATPLGPDSLTTKGVDGVTFTAYKVNVDLTTAGGWDNLAKVANKIPLDACTSGNLGQQVNATLTPVGTPQVTAGGGEATFSNLEVAAYLICETATPNHVVDKAAPFVVTIPFPDTISSGGKWLYDVHVYPKNAVQTAPTKAVEAPDGFGLGSTMKFPVTALLPKPADNSYYKYYWVRDVLDSRFSEVEVESVKIGDEILAANTDYTVTSRALTQGAEQGSERIVKLTAAGLIKAKNGKGKSLVVVFKAKVSGAVGNGEIQNIANIASDTKLVDTPPNPDTPPTPEEPPTPPYVPTNKVVTAWGDVKVKKVDAHDNATGLNGAQFKVYLGKQEFENCTKEKSTDKPDAVRVLVGDQMVDTFTSVDGVVTIPGLFIDRGVATGTNNPTPEHTTRCYVLEEVAAPTGYTLPQGDDARTALTVKVGTSNIDVAPDAQVTNTKQSVPALPMTGANGQLLMVIAGSALVLFAIGFAMVARRRVHRS